MDDYCVTDVTTMNDRMEGLFGGPHFKVSTEQANKDSYLNASPIKDAFAYFKQINIFSALL